MAPRTINRALNIDSVFRKDTLVTPSTDMQMTLPTTLPNVVEMAVSHVEVPPTFYNVSRALGNCMFVVNDGTAAPKVVRLPDGRYQVTHDQDKGQGTKTLADIELAVNNAMRAAGVDANFVFTVDKVTQRGVFATRHVPGGQPGVREMTLFFNVDCEGNIDEGGFVAGGLRTKLGWLLGFRSGTYWLKAPAGAAPNAVAAASEAAAYVPNSRYMYLVVDDYCNESYENFTSVFYDSLNTKNVLARVDLGDTVDHTRWTVTSRSYRVPVTLTRLRVALTDELGRVVDLNGVDWSAVLMLKCLVEG